MSRKLSPWLLTLVLLAAASTPSPALARGEEGAAPDRKIVERVTEAQAKRQTVVVKLKNGAKISGKVGEVREKGFTMPVLDPQKGYVTAAVFYDDVASVTRPSRLSKFFKSVGFWSLAVAGGVVVVPVYGVAALLGRLPSC